jgi:hypothetical protein
MLLVDERQEVSGEHIVSWFCGVFERVIIAVAILWGQFKRWCYEMITGRV